jgi:hypothetical protein
MEKSLNGNAPAVSLVSDQVVSEILHGPESNASVAAFAESLSRPDFWHGCQILVGLLNGATKPFRNV